MVNGEQSVVSSLVVKTGEYLGDPVRHIPQVWEASSKNTRCAVDLIGGRRMIFDKFSVGFSADNFTNLFRDKVIEFYEKWLD